ncbi:hypothetical protein [Gordonia shandongensis]|uniref:hypothetical protein n=1 Tax=Gordonia shandongensis TaxID=376351 RepID=UPI000418DE24|nr:hypothetical protein [Gordonia shandongensis]
MRKSSVVSACSIVLTVGLVVAALLGVFTHRTDGTAVPNEATRAGQLLGGAAAALADAPAVTYSGAIRGGNGLSMQLHDVTVSSTGDAAGRIGTRDGQAEIRLLGDLLLVKAGEKFWKERVPGQQLGVQVKNKTADAWTLAPIDVFGADLRLLLRPSRMGAALEGRQARTGDAEISGTVADPRWSDTPDVRVHTGRDPVGVTRYDEADEFDGSSRIEAGEVTTTLDDEDRPVGVSAPIETIDSDGRMPQASLSIDLLDSADTVYSKIEKTIASTESLPVASVRIDVGDGDLDCTFASCVMKYDVRNTAVGAVSGEVRITLTTKLTVNNVPGRSCTASAVGPFNGSTPVSCTIPVNESGNRDVAFNSSSQFLVTAMGRLDTDALRTESTRARTLTESAAGWRAAGVKKHPTARAYHRAIVGGASSLVYDVGGFAFDGREPDGTLLIVASAGYDAHVTPSGDLDPAWPGTAKVVELARAARSAAGSSPIRMVFAEQRAADATARKLAAEGVENIEVVAVAP